MSVCFTIASFWFQCFAWAWYLACDMQFYIVSPIFIYALYRYKLTSLFLAHKGMVRQCQDGDTHTFDGKRKAKNAPRQSQTCIFLLTQKYSLSGVR